MRAVAVWLLVIGVEAVNGAVHAQYRLSRVGDLRARQIGVFTGSALILTVAGLAAPRAAEAARFVRPTGSAVGSHLPVAPTLRGCPPSAHHGTEPELAGGRT